MSTRWITIALVLLLATANLTLSVAAERKASALTLNDFSADLPSEAVEVIEEEHDRRKLSWVLGIFAHCKFVDATGRFVGITCRRIFFLTPTSPAFSIFNFLIYFCSVRPSLPSMQGN